MTRFSTVERCPDTPSALPILAITEEEQAAGFGSVEDELKHLLGEKKAPMHVISVSTNIETEGAKFREMLQKEIGLDPGDGMKTRATISMLIGAWQAARQRSSAQEADAAAALLEGRQREMLPTAALSMRRAYQTTHGTKDRWRVPE